MRAKVIDKLISLVKGGFFIFLTVAILLIISCHLDTGSEKVSLGVALEEPFFEQVDMKESLFWNKDIVGSAQCMKGYFDEGTNRLMISVTSKCGNVEDYYQMCGKVIACVDEVSFHVKRGTGKYTWVAGVENVAERLKEINANYVYGTGASSGTVRVNFGAFHMVAMDDGEFPIIFQLNTNDDSEELSSYYLTTTMKYKVCVTQNYPYSTLLFYELAEPSESEIEISVGY